MLLFGNGECGRKYVKTTNDWDGIAEQTENLYEEILAH